jgi:hypothetical protein
MTNFPYLHSKQILMTLCRKHNGDLFFGYWLTNPTVFPIMLKNTGNFSGNKAVFRYKIVAAKF